MSEVKFARDMTRVMTHTGKAWRLADWSLVAIGGLSLQAGLIALVVGIAAGAVIAIALAVLFGMPFVLVFLAATVLSFAGVYLLLSRNRGGKQKPYDALKLWLLGWLRDPRIVLGAGRDREPRHLRWTVILWRPSWADIDPSRRPHLRPYNPEPKGDDSFAAPPPQTRTTFDDLLVARRTGQESA